MKNVIIITGPAGVGKSSVAEELTKRFAKTARIDVDTLRYMVKNGKVSPFPFTDEARKQVMMAVSNACYLAKNFADEGFVVFIDDVVASKEKLDLYFELLAGYELKVFLLMCDIPKLIERDKQRPVENQMGKRCEELHEKFKTRLDEKRWQVIETAGQDVNETVELILEEI